MTKKQLENTKPKHDDIAYLADILGVFEADEASAKLEIERRHIADNPSP